MKKIGKDIWVAEAKFKLFGADFGNRMTVIRLNNRKLLLHSPVKISDGLLGAIRELGEVGFIVTPNNFHGLFVEEWRKEFPDAKYFTAKELKRNDNSSFSLSSITSKELSPDVEIIKIEGAPKVNEYAFIHKASNTLILTDLAFNIGANVSFWSKIFFRLNGAFNKFGPTRLMKTMIADPAALSASIEGILAFEINRIIVSHGDILEENARFALKEAFRDLDAKPSKTTQRFSLSRCG
ncbi:MAG: DUF4336 domain-containing protein [Bacteroidetes bacterium]|nr:MAG: DUF4336 domain-containing protein [Bacteroidota bacterium]